jgi:hypothetical protein
LFLLTENEKKEPHYDDIAASAIEVSAELADASDIAAELVELVDVFIESDDSDDLRDRDES